MGWCSATILFDAVCSALLDNEGPVDKKEFIKYFIKNLWDEDWDCESDSYYFEHPVVKQAFIELGKELWFNE